MSDRPTISKRDNWSSHLGVILAISGSAVGLGNFLRFPVKAATNGGGAFLIPYFIALILLAVPLCWMEWALGRYASTHGHGTGPGLADKIIRRPWAKYAGVLPLIIPSYITFYYLFVQSWLLAFSWYALNGELLAAVGQGAISQFFGDFIMLRRPLGATGIPAGLFFFLLTFLINFTVLAFGVRRGIERLNRFATPILFVLGILLMLRVLTLPGISDGLGAMWNPDFSALTSPQVWLEASGQVFFTLSIAMGIILCYASYVRPGQDIILPSVTAIATNTFAEIILGGTIVVPLAVVLYGANVSEVARMGTFGLAFQTMPIVFGKLPLPDLLICLWFFMLFLAGITSCISIQQPLIAFCEDDLSWSRRRSILLVGLFSFLGSLVAVFGLAGGAVDELDFWGASFLLVVSGTLQAFLFAFVLGEEGWELLNEGAKRRLPRWIWWVMRWVTPFYLLVMLVAWTIHDGWRTIILQDIDSAASVTLLGYSVNHLAFLWGVRGFLLLILVLALLIIRHAWRKRGNRP